jgi:hypothetical protein
MGSNDENFARLTAALASMLGKGMAKLLLTLQSALHAKTTMT